MPAVTRTIEISANPGRVWERLADLGAVSSYSPNVHASHWTSAQRSGVGASRHCDLGSAGHAKERAVEWAERRGYTLEVYDGLPGVMRELLVTFELSEARPGRTRIRQTMRFAFRGGPFGALLALAAKGQFRKAIDTNLEGLKQACERVEEVAA